MCLLLLRFILYMWMFCLRTYIHTICMSFNHRSQKRASDLVELDLWMVVIHRVGAGRSSVKAASALKCWAISLYLYGCFAYVYVPGTQKKSSYPLDLEPQMLYKLKAICYNMWVLGIKPGSSVRAISALICWVTSPALLLFVFFFFFPPETGSLIAHPASHLWCNWWPRAPGPSAYPPKYWAL